MTDQIGRHQCDVWSGVTLDSLNWEHTGLSVYFYNYSPQNYHEIV